MKCKNEVKAALQETIRMIDEAYEEIRTSGSLEARRKREIDLLLYKNTAATLRWCLEGEEKDGVE